MMGSVEAVVVGGGVIGLAVARELAQVGCEVMVLERYGAIGEETSSRNSEVIHAGIYYAPGSLKARLCRHGKEMLYAYCADRGIAHKRCGKLIVAVEPGQMAKLQEIHDCAQANGVVDLAWLTAEDIARLEPEVRAVGGLFSPSTGIVDGHDLMIHLQGDLERHGGVVALHTPVTGLRGDRGRIAVTTGGTDPMTLSARIVVNAAGLGAQDVAATMPGLNPPPLKLAIGHYYALSGKSPFHHLVYPVPVDGGLGVHVTLDIAGQARFGPDVRWIDRIDYAFDDSRRGDFIAAIRQYYPGLEAARLQPAYTGIRPKLAGPGAPAADFCIEGPERHGIPGLVNLFGIESPGLTAALAIAGEVRQRLGM
jgi:L-2-hydroxyglutarate oxidase LhgO